MSMIQKHCYECGTALTERELEGEGIVPYCPQCGQFRFPMYNVAVSMVVINELTGQILLIRQYGKPHFILVAGYVNRGEQLEHAVCREVKEETGMTVTHVKFNRTKFFEPSNTLMCNFTAFVADASEFNPNKEIDSYQWFSPDDAAQTMHAKISRRIVWQQHSLTLILTKRTKKCDDKCSVILSDCYQHRDLPGLWH